MLQKFICCCLLIFCLTYTGFCQYTLSGQILDTNGDPLPGAVILLDDGARSSISDLEGEFLFQRVDAGKHDLVIRYIGYADYRSTVQIDMNKDLSINLSQDAVDIEQINIIANRLSKDSPFSYTEVGEEGIAVKNLAQDIPFLLEHTPSMVVTSDAGAGVGYTGMRLRGSDATRINVTINGVPVNDSESHGVFWVNLPDFGSSVQNVQIQRGVGSSTNGAASFGGTVALQTSHVSEKPFAKISGTYGSYDTRKLSVEAGTGLMKSGFSVDGRYSLIHSDGYVDRARADLDSWFVSAAKIGDNYSLRLNAFAGNEKTYQSWWGVPESRLGGNSDALTNHYFTNLGVTYETVSDSINLFNSDRRYNYYQYDNQVDDYGQDHLQLIYNVQANERIALNATLHYTKGQGFFEEYKVDQTLLDYGISDSGERSDLVRRRWLDNDFYGMIGNIDYQLNDNMNWLTGFGFNRYVGDHFGEVISVGNSFSSFTQEDPYYFSDAEKNDFNIYTKLNYSLSDKLKMYGDLQLRQIAYQTAGIDNDAVPIDVDESYTFFNPKVGLNYQLTPQDQMYASYAQANREPVRSDFTDAVGTSIPKPERLHDFELGYRRASTTYSFEANLFYMAYTDQLVVTGAVNDVGGAVRTNVDKSFRRGLELAFQWQVNQKLSISPNVTWSQNKIDAFTDIVIDYSDFSFVEDSKSNTDIALSPNFIFGNRISYQPSDGLNLSLLNKYVSQQYLDNTSNDSRTLDAYFVNDLVASYAVKNTLVKDLTIKLLVNNVLSERYSSNGYTFSYIFGDLITENFYYPQAERHVLLGLDISF